MTERIRVSLHQDERYPTFYIRTVGEYGGETIDVDAETLDRWKAAIAAYDAVQDEMEALFESAEAASRRAAAVAAAEKRAAEAQAEVERVRAMSDEELVKRPQLRRSEWY